MCGGNLAGMAAVDFFVMILNNLHLTPTSESPSLRLQSDCRNAVVRRPTVGGGDGCGCCWLQMDGVCVTAEGHERPHILVCEHLGVFYRVPVSQKGGLMVNDVLVVDEVSHSL